jgi:hypothetical protein
MIILRSIIATERKVYMPRIPDSIIDRIVYLEGIESQGGIKQSEKIELEQLKVNYPLETVEVADDMIEIIDGEKYFLNHCIFCNDEIMHQIQQSTLQCNRCGLVTAR